MDTILWARLGLHLQVMYPPGGADGQPVWCEAHTPPQAGGLAFGHANGAPELQPQQQIMQQENPLLQQAKSLYMGSKNAKIITGGATSTHFDIKCPEDNLENTEEVCILTSIY